MKKPYTKPKIEVVKIRLIFLFELTNKLGHLNALVGMGDFAPTDQDIAVKDDFNFKIKIQLDAFDALISNEEIKAFNSKHLTKNN